MKKKFIYLGKNIFLFNKFRNELSDTDFVMDRTPSDTLKRLERNEPIDVILFESTEDRKAIQEFILLFQARRHQNVLFFMLVNTKEYFSKTSLKLNPVLLQGANDSFYIRVDIHLSNGEIQHILQRIESVRQNHSADRSELLAETRRYKTPLWKRTFDLFFSSIALICLSPLLILTAIAIRLESKGPVFYTSKRVGSNYRFFNFYKFRSMYTDADKKVALLNAQNQYGLTKEKDETRTRLAKEEQGPLLIDDENTIHENEHLSIKRKRQEASFFKVSNDPRITKVGRIIRNTSIDELLQLINILKGEMSVVGNRPLPLYEAETLTNDQWAERFHAPAGLTGLWQVSKRAKSTKMSPEERKKLDIDYSRNFSFKSDLIIILRTFPALLQHENV